jgi:hypothetical protein
MLFQRMDNMEDLRLQLKVMRQEVRILQKKTAEIVKARQGAELQIKEYAISSYSRIRLST